MGIRWGPENKQGPISPPVTEKKPLSCSAAPGGKAEKRKIRNDGRHARFGDKWGKNAAANLLTHPT